MRQTFDDSAEPAFGPRHTPLIRAAMAEQGLDGFVVPHEDEHQNEYLPKANDRLAWATGFTGSAGLGTVYNFPAGQTAAAWHTYGMIWSPGSVAYYVDNPAQPYVTYANASLTGLAGAAWPFDAGQSSFILLNMAIGGDWPGPPNSSTPFPSQMLVDYVRIYTK